MPDRVIVEVDEDLSDLIPDFLIDKRNDTSRPEVTRSRRWTTPRGARPRMESRRAITSRTRASRVIPSRGARRRRARCSAPPACARPPGRGRRRR